MEPTRDPNATLPDLLEVLLNKGVHLNLDLIISVADIPLIGVNLRATIAGIETMLEYGMMRQWDDQTRAWVQKSLAKHLAMGPDEEVIAAMAASHYQAGFHRTWRPGRAYVTTERLLIHRRDPAETLWEAPLTAIESIEPFEDASIGGEARTRLLVRTEGGSEATLSAADPQRLASLVQESIGAPRSSTSLPPDQAAAPRMSGHVWYLETLANSTTWRGGRATLGADSASGMTELTWRSPMDSRASVRLDPADVLSVALERRSNPTDESEILVVETSHSVLRLASSHPERWREHLTEWSTEAKEAGDGAAG